MEFKLRSIPVKRSLRRNKNKSARYASISPLQSSFHSLPSCIEHSVAQNKEHAELAERELREKVRKTLGITVAN